MKNIIFAAAAALAMITPAVAEGARSDSDVLALSVYTISDKDAWKSAIAPYGRALASEKGFIGSANFMSIMGFAPVGADGTPIPNVFVTMMQVDDAAAYTDLVTKHFGANKSAEVAAYLQTLTSIVDTGALLPFRETPAVDLAQMVKPGQVLEIAVRDVSAVDFDDFDAKRKAFVDVLLAQAGVIAEHEYRSSDGKYYVGMTLYESGDAVQAVFGTPAVSQGPEIAALMAEYPPLVSQFLIPLP